jgi:LAS superfamily LD-carboxypeptidase LdcB
MMPSASTPYPEGVLIGALVPIWAPSIYSDHKASLPARMAWLTPDAAEAFGLLRDAVNRGVGDLYVSDCYRSTLDQARAHADYLAGAKRFEDLKAFAAKTPGLAGYTPKPKRAFSPPPGGSFHEAGRAIDVDMDPKWMGLDNLAFAALAHSFGWRDVVGGNFGAPGRVDVTEEWHWQYLGPFAATFDALVCTMGKRTATKEVVARAIAALKETP